MTDAPPSALRASGTEREGVRSSVLACLEGATVRLRPVRASDAGAVLAMLQGPDAEFFALGEEAETEPALAARLGRLEGVDPAWGGAWAVTAPGGDEALGVVLFGDRQAKDQRAVIAYILAAPARGRGLMRAALVLALDHLFTLGLHRLEADVEPDNLRSRRLLAELGFRCESGLLRDRVVTRGMRRSVVMYALLAPAWWALRAGRLQDLRTRPCAG